MTRQSLNINGLDLEIEASAVEAVGVDAVRVSGRLVGLRSSAGFDKFYRHGWHSWSLAHWADLGLNPYQILVPGLQRQADDPRLAEVAGHVGSWVGALETSDGRALLLGAAGLDARVTADEHGMRGAAADDIEWVVLVGQAETLLATYAKELAKVFGSSKPSEIPNVWCSWNSFGPDIDQGLIRRAAAEVAPEEFDVCLIDDGWQEGVGEWAPNDKFADGMELLASEIRGYGLTPGLWLSPFVVHNDLADTLSDLLVRTSDGALYVTGFNWDGVYHSLDLAKREAVDYAAQSISQAVAWGYRFLKLDFLFAGAVNPLNPRPEFTYRKAAEVLRACAGEDVRILACGAPIVPSIGVFDAIRVGSDVAPYWQNPLDRHVQDYSAPGMRMAISTSLSRLWLAEAIDADPDMSYFSQNRNLLSEEDQSLQRSLAVITGVKSSSVRVPELNPRERETLRHFLQASHEITRISRYRFVVDGEPLDFSRASMDGVSGLS